METELNLCPFCGGNAELRERLRVHPFYVVCNLCGAQTEYFEDKEEAVEAWNRRINNG